MIENGYWKRNFSKYIRNYTWPKAEIIEGKLRSWESKWLTKYDGDAVARSSMKKAMDQAMKHVDDIIDRGDMNVPERNR
jgi:hypothetical protein